MSDIYEKAKENYEKGFWSKKMLKALVKKGSITPAEYETITGEAYA